MVNPRELDALLAKAVNAHQAGRLTEAQSSYKVVLKAVPGHVPTLHFLGLCYLQQGKLDRGMELVRKALVLKPDYIEAHYNLATALQGLGRFEDAIIHYRATLDLDPNNADAHNNLGAALHELKRYQEAIGHFQKALALRPGLPGPYNNIGTALKELHRYQEAVSYYQAALKIDPRNAETLCNFGAVLLEVGRSADALMTYQNAAAIDQELPDAYVGLGNTLSNLSRFDAALAGYQRALAIKPDLAEAWLGLANLHGELKQYNDAVSAYRKALTLKPDLPYAPGSLLYAKMNNCDWTGLDADCARIVADVERGAPVTTPWLLLGVSPSVQTQLKCSQNYVRHRYPEAARKLWNGERYAHDRIRVAYLSADMRDRGLAHLLLEFFERHDRTRFETFAFSFGPPDTSAMRARFANAFDHFIDVYGKSSEEIAELVHLHQIDIAVDIMGFTQNGRPGIFAMRPAPLQVNYICYTGTMGADYIDYIIADRVVVPPEHQPYYSEKVAYLPGSYQVSDTMRKIPSPDMPRRAAGLPEHGFVFCAFSNSYKITPGVFDIWMRLLNAVDGAVLWLLHGPCSGNLRREAQKRGVDPDRLIFAPRMSRDDHLARHVAADLFLDTLPYNAHTTACDALWAGRPILTCLGSAFTGRVAASLLTAVGLSELISHSLQDYEALALALAREPDRLAAVCQKLAVNRRTHPLFDIANATRDVESAYLMMWERQRDGLPPATFSVPRT